MTIERKGPEGGLRLAVNNRFVGRASPDRCGNCRLWMTRACPQETNVRGRNYGPSMNGIPCDQFDRERKPRLIARTPSP